MIDVELIDLDLKGRDRDAAILSMIELIDKKGRLADKDIYRNVVMERELLGSTNIGFGVSIPHGKSDVVKIPTVAFGRSNAGIQWGTADEQMVNMVFLIAVPEKAASNQHLRILAALSRKLINEEFRAELFNMKDRNLVLQILEDALVEVAVS